MNRQNPVEATPTSPKAPDFMNIDAHVREAVRLRNEAMGALLAAAWHGLGRRLALLRAALAGRRDKPVARLPSLPVPHP